MPDQLTVRCLVGALLALSLAGPGTLHAQAPVRGDALSAVGEAMYFRRSALGDSLPFDACSVYERTGRPAGFPQGLLPGVRPLLDHPVADPCGRAGPEAGVRYPRVVRVDSVVIADSTAQVHLQVRRGEWAYNEVHHLVARPGRGGWGMREVRTCNAIQILPPPPRQP